MIGAYYLIALRTSDFELYVNEIKSILVKRYVLDVGWLCRLKELFKSECNYNFTCAKVLSVD